MGALSLGFMAFVSGQFWMALYMQQVQGHSGLEITLRLLPMVVGGVSVNIVCALVLHRVSNKLLMYIATTAYMLSFLIASFTKEDSGYWGFYFVPFIFMVVGADIEFNVVNVRTQILSSKDASRTNPPTNDSNRCTSCLLCHHPSSL